MAALTWREVTAPNLGNSISSVLQANQLVNQGFGGLTSALQGLYDQRRTQNTDTALATILGSEKAEDVSSLVRSAIVGGQSNGPINVAALGEAGNRQINTLMQREESRNRLDDQQARRDITPSLAAAYEQARRTGDFSNLPQEFLSNRVSSEFLDDIMGTANGTRSFKEGTRQFDLGYGLDRDRFRHQQQQAAISNARADRAEARERQDASLFGLVDAAVKREGAAGTALTDIQSNIARQLLNSGQIKTPAQLQAVMSATTALTGLRGQLPAGTALGANQEGRNVTATSLGGDLRRIASNAEQKRNASAFRLQDENPGLQIWNDAQADKGKSITDLAASLAEFSGQSAPRAAQEIETYAKAHNIPQYVAANALRESVRPAVAPWVGALNPFGASVLNRVLPARVDRQLARSRGNLAAEVGRQGGEAYLSAELNRDQATVNGLEAQANTLAQQIQWNAANGNAAANAGLLMQLNEIDRALGKSR